jgi:hypothetical protein
MVVLTRKQNVEVISSISCITSVTKKYNRLHVFILYFLKKIPVKLPTDFYLFYLHGPKLDMVQRV